MQCSAVRVASAAASSPAAEHASDLPLHAVELHLPSAVGAQLQMTQLQATPAKGQGTAAEHISSRGRGRAAWAVAVRDGLCGYGGGCAAVVRTCRLLMSTLAISLMPAGPMSLSPSWSTWMAM